MAYDEQLADRVRERFAGEPDVSERAMFGGLAFLVRGHMTVAVSHDGGLLVRVAPADAAKLRAAGDALAMEMGGRPMAGWLRVEPAQLQAERQLTTWVRRAQRFVATLPPKPPTRRRSRTRR